MRALLMAQEPVAGVEDTHPEWEVVHAEGEARARELLGQGAFDAVIAELDLAGDQLLREIARDRPSCVRVALADGDDLTRPRAIAGVAHQCLRPPFDGAALARALAGAWTLRRDGDPSSDTFARLAQLGALPALPRHHQALLDELNSEDPNIVFVAEIIADDPAMSTKLLQLVNSAYFGLAQRVLEIKHAALLLGVALLRDLTVSHAVFEALAPHADGELLEHLWREGHVVAAVVDRLTSRAKVDEAVRGPLRIAGFLHGVGRLALLCMGSADYPASTTISVAEIRTAELEQFGVDHAQAGAYLLALWGLPDPLVQSVHDSLHGPEETWRWEHGWWLALALRLVDAPLEQALGGEGWPALAQWAAVGGVDAECLDDACREASALVHGAA